MFASGNSRKHFRVSPDAVYSALPDFAKDDRRESEIAHDRLILRERSSAFPLFSSDQVSIDRKRRTRKISVYTDYQTIEEEEEEKKSRIAIGLVREVVSRK